MTNIVQKSCLRKQAYKKAKTAKIAKKNMEERYNRPYKIYTCDYCFKWHVARKKQNKKRNKKNHHIIENPNVQYSHLCAIDDPWKSDKGVPVLHTSVIDLAESRELLTYRCINCELIWKIDKW